MENPSAPMKLTAKSGYSAVPVICPEASDVSGMATHSPATRQERI